MTKFGKFVLNVVYFVLVAGSVTVLLAQRDFEEVGQDSATSASAKFRVKTGQYLAGLILPDRATGQDSIFFLVSYDGQEANFDTLWYNGEIYYEVVDTVSHVLTLQFKKQFVWEWYKVATDQAVADTVTWVPYKLKLSQ